MMASHYKGLQMGATQLAGKSNVTQDIHLKINRVCQGAHIHLVLKQLPRNSDIGQQKWQQMTPGWVETTTAT